jgi:hypothetical protein
LRWPATGVVIALSVALQVKLGAPQQQAAIVGQPSPTAATGVPEDCGLARMPTIVRINQASVFPQPIERIARGTRGPREARGTV